MKIDPNRVTFRAGSDPRYVNIDYDGREVGNLLIEDGVVVRSWANNFADRPLIDFTARTHGL